MKEAIGMARWLVKTSVRVKARLANAQRELTLHRNAQKMLKLIPEGSSSKWRKVCRKLHAHSKSFHQLTVEHLLVTGQIVRHPDGSLERLSNLK